MVSKRRRGFGRGTAGWPSGSALTLTALLAMSSVVLLAQSANVDERFLAADVHPAASNDNNDARFSIKGDRYLVHDATMADMIAAAYGMKAGDILGGPSWLEWDRFNLVAKVPPGTTRGTVQPMMQALLRERFQLAAHSDTKPVPAFALTVGKDKVKMKPGDPSAPGSCKGGPQTPANSPAAMMVYECVNQSMEMIVADLGSMARQYVAGPVVDQTALKGVWDFELKWTPKGQLALAGSTAITFPDAVQNGLGLHLQAATVPMPVLVVESVNEKPTPNAADIEKLLPPLPPAELEVSVIRPTKPDAQMSGRITADQMNFDGLTLDQLIRSAWNLPDDGPMLTGGPDWVRKEKWSAVAKAAKTQSDPPMDEEDWDTVLQKLLEERFKLVVHTKEMTVDAYDLVAVKAKMKRADPAERTRCFAGVGPDGKDPRAANPMLNKIRTCQGITMAQFASTIPEFVGYVNTPVQDMTNLEGAYDFTVAFSGAGRVQNQTARPQGDAAADPGIVMSFADALEKEVGLRLQQVKRPVTVMVIDHVEMPAEN